MSDDEKKPEGPDLIQGVPLTAIADDGMLLGHVGDEAVVVARRGEEIFAIGAKCTHYEGPLAKGIIVGDTIRCPWHHACFSLRTGEALAAPALDPVACWRVERRDGTVFVTGKIDAPTSKPVRGTSTELKNVLILGGGGAGNAAAEMLRRQGFSGRIAIFSTDDSLPCDRPNLSKDYLAGEAQDSWIPLRSPDFYKEHGIELRLGAQATMIDPPAKEIHLADGSRHPYDALLLATGAEPVRLKVPGADHPHVHYLRSLADSRSLIAAANKARRVVIIGASFIGLEVAASLRTRNLEVHVVGPEARPLEKVLGSEIADLIRKIHEDHKVTFHLGTGVRAIGTDSVTLESGEALAADLVVVGIGVKPRIRLAEQAGLAIDRGISVDAYLETSVPGIFAAGDIARWPDALSGDRIRVEHWVVAERQGQVAARNIMGQRRRFDAVPFFWSKHYDLSIRYVGHAETWDRTTIEGTVAAKNCEVTYYREGRKLAVASIARDRENLIAEAGFEAFIAGS